MQHDPYLSEPAWATIARQQDTITDLVKALELAHGRLQWAASANPGVRDAKGRELVASWAAETRGAIERIV